MKVNTNDLVLGALGKKRSHYPFDGSDDEEGYESELDEEDDEEITKERRFKKDNLEKQIRLVDLMKNVQFDSDEQFISMYRKYLETKKNPNLPEVNFCKVKQVSTVAIYTGVLRVNILTTLHRVIIPFDAKFLLDCVTPKFCTYNGIARSFVQPEEPI